MVLHSNRMESLRDLLVQFVQRDPLPPLSAETILVQSNGMKHWLTLSLAADQALGICAATRMELPATQMWRIYRLVLGAYKLPAQMPLDKAPLVWRLLRRLPEWLKDPTFAPLAHYLKDDTHGMRAFGLAQQLADVLDGYQNYRADWLAHWAAGHDILRPGQALPADQCWQAALWRDLLADVQAQLPGAQAGYLARSDVHKAFMQALEHLPPAQITAVLPPRLLVFGITALPLQTLQALVALGRFIPVLMFVHNPSQEHWGHLTESLTPEGHPLLAAWGKHGRDYLHAIDEFEQAQQQTPFQRVDVFSDPVQVAQQAGQQPSALQQLQSDILHLHTPAAEPAMLTQPDHSFQFVQTHSMQREVEVLHDQILSWLDSDPTLQPQDIMVMVPDMAEFAPHIHSVFGRFQHQHALAGSRHVPYSVADTTSHQDPMVQALQTLLHLPQLRWSLTNWLEIFQVAAVRERFGLRAQDVQDLHRLLQDAGVRWGLDADHRQRWGVPAQTEDADHNTWLFGLQRLLLGYATGDSHEPEPWHDTLPHAGIDGLDASLISGLLRGLQEIQSSLQWLSQDHPPTAWVQLLQDLVMRFFKAPDEASQRLLDRLVLPLAQWLNDCDMAQFNTPLPLAVVRSHWLAQLDSAGLQRRFLGGGVQFATLMPMRAIPFKVVCLLGMNDGAYPRAPAPRDFDLMSQPAYARAGDRARREDDRYLFLEALLSARDRVYVSWQGRRASDHAELPPSVLVAQLLDHLNASHALTAAPAPSSQDLRKPAFVARLQPLQAFSVHYFKSDSEAWTYAKDWETARSPQQASEPRPLSNNPISLAAPVATLTEQELGLLLRHPEEVYFRFHLQARLDPLPESSAEDEPFELNRLQAFVFKQSVMWSEHPEALVKRLEQQGQLAWSGFGHIQQADMLDTRQQVLSHIERWLALPHQPVPSQILKRQAHGVDLALRWGQDPHAWRQCTDGSVLQLNLRPGKVLNTSGQARLDTLASLWLGHLSANAAGVPTTSLQSGVDGWVGLKPLPAAQATSWIEDLVAVFLQAWQQPLPLARQTACAWLMTMHAPHADDMTAEDRLDKALRAAQQIFEGGFQRQGEQENSPYLQRAFPAFDDLRTDLPNWAERVYGPMMQTLMLSDESIDVPTDEGSLA